MTYLFGILTLTAFFGGFGMLVKSVSTIALIENDKSRREACLVAGVKLAVVANVVMAMRFAMMHCFYNGL